MLVQFSKPMNIDLMSIIIDKIVKDKISIGIANSMANIHSRYYIELHFDSVWPYIHLHYMKTKHTIGYTTYNKRNGIMMVRPLKWVA